MSCACSSSKKNSSNTSRPTYKPSAQLKSLARHSIKVLVDYYCKGMDRRSDDFVWLSTLTGLYFLPFGLPRISPAWAEIPHNQILAALPKTPIGEKIRSKAFNKDGSLSTYYKDLVRRCTYRDRTVGQKKADLPEKEALCPFLCFQPDNRTMKEKLAGTTKHSPNHFEPTAKAMELLEGSLQSVEQLLQWFGQAPSSEESTPSVAKPTRQPRRRNSRRGEEPDWVEAERDRQEDHPKTETGREGDPYHEGDFVLPLPEPLYSSPPPVENHEKSSSFFEKPRTLLSPLLPSGDSGSDPLRGTSLVKTPLTPLRPVEKDPEPNPDPLLEGNPQNRGQIIPQVIREMKEFCSEPELETRLKSLLPQLKQSGLPEKFVLSSLKIEVLRYKAKKDPPQGVPPKTGAIDFSADP